MGVYWEGKCCNDAYSLKMVFKTKYFGVEGVGVRQSKHVKPQLEDILFCCLEQGLNLSFSV